MDIFWIIIVCSTILGAFLTFLVKRRNNEALFELWVKDFEKELGREVSHEDKIYILGHLYIESWSVNQAVKRYKELEGLK